MKIFTAIAFLFFCTTTAHAVTFEFAHIGNAGNAGDVQTQGTFGAVAYNYAISKTEVTNEQYTEFLNAVAATDSYGLYDSSMGSTAYGGITQSGTSGNYTYEVKADAGSYTYANKPVVYVTWYDSVRFTNWLHNGQGAGDTETGAYTLLGGTPTPSNGLSVTRENSAAYWLPSEDEWYKAAYHDAAAGTAGTYFEFATGTDIDPDNNLPTSDSGNSVNHHDGSYTTGDPLYPYTDVGDYGLSASTYGTYNQNGNVMEWNEAIIGSSSHGVRGGSWSNGSNFFGASFRFDTIRSNGSNGLTGFRVATVPEPSSLLLGAFITVGLLIRKRRSR